MRVLTDFVRSAIACLALSACGRGDSALQAGANAEPTAESPPGSGPREQAPAPSEEEGGSTPAQAGEDALQSLQEELRAAGSLDADGLRARYALEQRAALSYDPAAAEFLDRIQASALALSDAELHALGRRGFVVSTRREFPTFARGLIELYSEHLPLYVTADALLEAVHSSYAAVIELLERNVLVPELGALLGGMRSRLASASAPPETLAAMDLYLSVAAGLLSGETPAPAAGAAPSEIEQLLALASAASGSARITLFGVERDEDFSQFAPRGHYQSTPLLQRYFRALTWLGRVDLRLLEARSDGSLAFRRAQYASALLMAALAGPDLARFERIDSTIRAFAGESDAMILSELSRLIADLGGPEAAQSASDELVVAAISAGDYGKQQIASQLITNPGAGDALPRSRSFALFGPRYVVDSHVLSEVVHDRVQGRLMPSPLDAAFAALGNDQALAFNDDLARFSGLPGALARMRVLVDAHDGAFWDANLYNLWLRAIRALSPGQALAHPDAAGMPEVMRTEAWGRRILSTQLAAWAELRHDAQAYAKQSYTTGAFCEFPDAYVDPYPALYEALHAYALHGLKLVEQLAEVSPSTVHWVSEHFGKLAGVMSMLRDMAERELRGEPFSEAQLAFINQAVVLAPGGCGSPEGTPSGWYAGLFLMPHTALQFDPIVADVHTQPTDDVGTEVGNILHVGTGYPRLLVTTVDTCVGPRAYAGVVSAYHEQITTDFDRMSDARWAARLQLPARPTDVRWLAGALAD